MANLKTKKTAAGAQQYSSKGKAKELSKKFDKDMGLVHDGDMTRAEFKDKYGMSVSKAQNMIYAAEAAERVKESGDKKTDSKDYERYLSRRKTFAKGGYANCGASVPGTQKK